MATNKVEKLLQQVGERLASIESLIGSKAAQYSKSTAPADARPHCRVPQVVERPFDPGVSEERARLVRVISKKWVNGTVLHYWFADGGPDAGGEDQMDVVREAFDVWRDVGIGLRFVEVDSPAQAELRIGFRQDDGAWSYIGRDVLGIGQGERTMNIGWDIAEPKDLDTPIHEIGHSLGFPHEHQNPNAGIVWDEEAVYAYFAGWPNFWDRQTTFHNIIRKIPPDTVEGSRWDHNSVMHYAFRAGLILQPEDFHENGVRPDPGLSEKDIEQARFFYPAQEEELAPLELLAPQVLDIAPGQQLDFSLEPEATRDYHLATFGPSDTVIVLFEDDSGTPRYVKGDDDGGLDRNSHIQYKLFADRRYILRVRLYYEYAEGRTAVMVW